MSSTTDELIYDWNRVGAEAGSRPRAVTFYDETLRDGLQHPTACNPKIEEKLRILHLMEDLEIDAVDLGLPGSGRQIAEDVTRLAQEISRCRMKIRPNCAARTVRADIQPIIEISQSVGIPIEVCTFIGSSSIRQYAEDWTLDMMMRAAEDSVRFAIQNGLPTMFVTEDTVRAHPDTLRKLYGCALDSGATALCVCDTVGHAIPQGAAGVVRFVVEEILKTQRSSIRVDWHGHMDRGLGVINSIAAVEAGADQVLGCALGIGERVGNTPMDLLLVNMRLLGYIGKNLTHLKDYCETVAQACKVSLPANYPVVGADAFRTGTGVHAVAVIKAMRKGDVELANLVYSGVPAHWFGMEQIIEVGPMSGRSNVIHWLERHRIEPLEGLVADIFRAAKDSRRILSDAEIQAIVDAYPSKLSSGWAD